METRHKLEAFNEQLERKKREDKYFRKMIDCKYKYYGINGQYTKCSQGFFAFFRNEKDQEACKDKVYQEFLRCINK